MFRTKAFESREFGNVMCTAKIADIFYLSVVEPQQMILFDCVCRTFAPVWQILKNSSEKLSGLHIEMMHKFQELVKDVQRYNEEQHKKHKSVIMEYCKALNYCVECSA